MTPRTMIQLVSPAESYRESFLRGLREFQGEGLPWWTGGDLDAIEQDFAAFVARKLADATRRTDTFVPATHLWAMMGGAFVGRISLRHELTASLRTVGGHIGYDTVPSFRRRGIATEMLRQALPVASTVGLAEVLITCDDTNAASIRVIEKNGGVLRGKVPAGPTGPLKRHYVIALAAATPASEPDARA